MASISKKAAIFMPDSPLIIKSKHFALQIIKVCNYVKQTKKESVLTTNLSAAEQA